MKRIKGIVSVVLVMVLILSMTSALACTPMGAGKNATVDGSVMVSHTCDGWYDNRLQVVPGGEHPAGEMIDIYVDLCTATRPYAPLRLTGQIPQVEKTNTYFHIGYPFMNDKQLMIGEHTWSGRQEVATPNGMLYIANLEQLGLQRASTAKEAIKVMGDLAEKYGYGDGGETLVVGDTQEIWVLEICGGGPLWTPESGMPGAHWVAQRLADDEFYVGANRARIGVIDFEDPEKFMYSTDITKLPLAMDWWKEGDPFNYSEIFHPATAQTFGNSRREWRAFSLVAPSQDFPIYDRYEQYPFSVKPDELLSVQDFIALYSDHLEGTPYDMTQGAAAQPFGNPNRWGVVKDQIPQGREGTGFERAIAIHGCSYSFISQSRDWLPDPVGGVLWFGEDAPDTTVYVPIYCGVTEIPKPWTQNLRHQFDRDSAWWAFNVVNNYAQLNWNVMYPEIRAKKASYEDAFFAEQPTIENEAVKLYNVSPEKAVEYLTKLTSDRLNTVEQGWWDFAWHLMGKYFDGGMINEEGRKVSTGYPTEYLESIDYGGTIIRDREMINQK